MYTGVTNNILKRTYEHRQYLHDGFTKKYHINKLVYFEESPDVKSAIAREKQLKRWHRDWKKDLIEKNNPDWQDLYIKLI